MYQESDYLQLSGIQHFRFCRRQWALIHVENQWAENSRTADGQIFHQRAHDSGLREHRGDLIITRDMHIFSPRLGVTGACDVVEFRRGTEGTPLAGEEGLFQPYPVEYKHGSPRADTANDLQLCGQAMCLEEMLCCVIPEGALYYGDPRRRTPVLFTGGLRQAVSAALEEMHQLYRRGHTPKVRPAKSCSACSLKELCLPILRRRSTVADYLARAMEDTP